MTDQTIVAVYDTPAHAETAVQDLLAAKVPESAISRHAQEGSYTGGSSQMTARSSEDQGFWSSLFGGEPDHDTAVYDRSVREGSAAVTVKVPDAHVAAVTDILERHNPIDIDERAGRYGLTQTTTTRAPLTAQTTGSTTAPAAAMAKASNGETLQLSEETLAIGKRVINRGTTRIRRFVVETPVEQQVSLHDERVTIERHPVTGDRAPTDSFGEKTIAVTETGEEAVVGKQARVVEEVAIRKDAADRTETVRDTVRREDVEIVKVAGDGTLTSTNASTTKTR